MDSPFLRAIIHINIHIDEERMKFLEASSLSNPYILFFYMVYQGERVNAKSTGLLS